MGRRRSQPLRPAVRRAAPGAVSARHHRPRRRKLGLDLSGGIELIYEARATGADEEVTDRDIEQSINIIRERIDELGVAEPEVARLGSDQISVALPDVQNAQRAIEQVGTTAQLFFYDWEPNLLGISEEGRAAARVSSRLSGSWSSSRRSGTATAASRTSRSTSPWSATARFPTPMRRRSSPPSSRRGPTARTARIRSPASTSSKGGAHELIAGPETRERDLFTDGHRRSGPRQGTEVVEVPPGTPGLRIPRRPEPRRDDRGGRPGLVCDQRPRTRSPAMRSRTRSRPSTRSTSRSSSSTSPTRAARRSRRSRRRSPGAAPRQAATQGVLGAVDCRDGGRVLGQLRRRPRQRGGHPADHQLPGEPERDRRPHRRRDLRRLQRPAGGAGHRDLPADRRAAGRAEPDQPEPGLGHARPAGARPGPEGGPDRARARRPVPARLLPLPRPGRGDRPRGLRGLLLRPGEADPDHDDAARASPA